VLFNEGLMTRIAYGDDNQWKIYNGSTEMVRNQ